VATSATIGTTNDLAGVPGESLLPWINRGLEGLWLLTVFLVPLMFLGQSYSISEAQIAYVEVPKVALLRGLAGLIAILWITEWAIRSRAFDAGFSSFTITNIAGKFTPSRTASGLAAWLKVHPTRWLVLAAGLFFGSTLLSTVLSGAASTSIWGEVPGQDGYSAYTISSYFILFAVIATHLKGPGQLGRLLGALVLMGVFVGLYGSLQHYGHDFLGITEITGGGTSRVTAFMGNTIFAGAVLSMTVPATLVAAAMHFQAGDRSDLWPLSKLRQFQRDSVVTPLWALILSIQLLGLMFTFSRGPWLGAVSALALFLGLVLVSMGWRMLIRNGLVLGLAGVLAFSFLHWQGNISIVDIGGWLAIPFALMGVAGATATLYLIQRFGRVTVFLAVMGIVVIIVGASVIAPSALSGRGSAPSTVTSAGGESTADQISGRITSIKTEVLGGFTNGRSTHWQVSWELIKNRPWFEFDDLSLNWLRPLIGYGPDLFRFTYLLESPTEAEGFRPLEPDHAHNFFIHQTVEQGILGGIASLALFGSVFGVTVHHILRRRNATNSVYRMLLIGLAAVIFGRFLEMMVGVARISDLTVLWVLFALFAALLKFENGDSDLPKPVAAQPVQGANRRERRRAARTSAARSFSTGLIFRLAIVVWVVGGIGVVTWQKSINSVRASVAEGRALKHFQQGNLESTVEELDNAIRLAPGIPTYYNNRAQIFIRYQFRQGRDFYQACNQHTGVPYLVCLGVEGLESNLEAVSKQPFYYRSRIAAANSAFNLQLHDLAIISYSAAAGMVPGAFLIRNYLAESMINSGLYNDALKELDRSLGITGDTTFSTRAYFLRGRALDGLGQSKEAIGELMGGLSLTYRSESAQHSVDLIRDIRKGQDRESDIFYFDELINNDPKDAVSIYFRGLAHLKKGDAEKANLDFEKAYSFGFQLNEVRANRAYTRFKLGDTAGSKGELGTLVDLSPLNALFHAYHAEFQLNDKAYPQALRSTEISIDLDPNQGLAHLVQAKIFLSLGLEDSAKEALSTGAGLALPTVNHYIDRGDILGSFGETESAWSDISHAISLNPNLGDP